MDYNLLAVKLFLMSVTHCLHIKTEVKGVSCAYEVICGEHYHSTHCCSHGTVLAVEMGIQQGVVSKSRDHELSL